MFVVYTSSPFLNQDRVGVGHGEGLKFTVQFNSKVYVLFLDSCIRFAT